MKKWIISTSIVVVSVLVTYVSLFKTVMVVSYERTEGCETRKDFSDSVLVSPDGRSRDLAGLPLLAMSSNKEYEKPFKIKQTNCFNQSVCEVWEMPGLVNSSMITLLVKGPSLDHMIYPLHLPGTPLGEAQKYFSQYQIPGIVVARSESAPSCLNMRIMNIAYAHALRWDWADKF